MGGAVVSFSVMAIAVRELLRTLGTFEILFLRSLVSLILLAAAVPVSKFKVPGSTFRFQNESRRTQRPPAVADHYFQTRGSSKNVSGFEKDN